MTLRLICVMMLSAVALGGMGRAPEGANELPPELRAPRPVPAEEDRAVAPRASVETLEIREAAQVVPEDFLWKNRIVVVFADRPEDPAFAEQIRALQEGASELVARDVIVLTDTDPATGEIWRERLHPSAGFSMVVIDKDGQVKLRKPFPWSAREIWRAIDKFPARRQEIGRAGLVPS